MNTTKHKPLIFILDDNKVVRELLAFHFSEHNNWNVQYFTQGHDLLKALHQNPDVVILDYHLGESKNGDFFLKRTKRFPTLILSGQRKIDIAVKLLKQGAYDYIVKDENVLFKLEKSIEKILTLKTQKHNINHHKQNIKADLMNLLVFCVALLSFLFFIF